MASLWFKPGLELPTQLGVDLIKLTEERRDLNEA